MNINVIENDREQLNADRISGQLGMTSSSQPIRAHKEADAPATVERVGPAALIQTALHAEVRADQNSVISISVELRKAALSHPDSRARPASPVYAVAKRAFDL